MATNSEKKSRRQSSNREKDAGPLSALVSVGASIGAISVASHPLTSTLDHLIEEKSKKLREQRALAERFHSLLAGTVSLCDIH